MGPFYKDSDQVRAPKSSRTKRPKLQFGHPSTSDMDYSSQELEFMEAMQEFKITSGRTFPTWCETLRVLSSLGYRQTEPRSEEAA